MFLPELGRALICVFSVLQVSPVGKICWIDSLVLIRRIFLTHGARLSVRAAFCFKLINLLNYYELHK